MQHAVVAMTTQAGPTGAFDVDLPLDAATLNERLFDISLWLMERHIPHQPRIRWEPHHRRIRVSFPVNSTQIPRQVNGQLAELFELLSG